MIDCVHCGNPYEGECCPHGCGSANAEADVLRVLDIAYGRELYAALESLEQTQDVFNACGNGVWRRSSKRLWVLAPELSLRNLPPEWDVQRGTWSSGPYRK